MSLRLAVSLLAATLLAACAEKEPRLTRPDVGPRTEHTIYTAIDAVHASDAQRLAILDAYDASNGRLRELSAQSSQVMSQWRDLDRMAPGFTAQVDALAAQWASINAGEMKARAAFERQVAAILGTSQWGKWQDFMRSGAGRERDYFLGGRGPEEDGPEHH
ncbi:MAG: hypothetical protein ISP90_12955 [Nevskia sp.]|nr:hypothetical protein [Nevskia sp.]